MFTDTIYMLFRQVSLAGGCAPSEPHQHFIYGNNNLKKIIIKCKAFNCISHLLDAFTKIFSLFSNNLIQTTIFGVNGVNRNFQFYTGYFHRLTENTVSFCTVDLIPSQEVNVLEASFTMLYINPHYFCLCFVWCFLF